jgi:uridine kinase
MKNILIKNPLFWVGLGLRLLCFFFVPATVAQQYFLPFLDKAVQNFGANPWSLLPPQYFPYGSLLFGVMYIPKFLFFLVFGDAALGLLPLSLLAFKLPLLICDISFLLLLMLFPQTRKSDILKYYWLNPVLIFISYIHCQLDIFAIYFVFLSLYQLFADNSLDKKIVFSSLFLGFATLCKFHVAAVVPLVLLYLWNSEFQAISIKSIMKWLGVYFITVAVGFLPHMMSSNFGYVSLTSPEAGKLFSLSLSLGDNVSLYLGPALILILIARLLLSSRITPLGVLMGAGLLFSTIILSTHAMPGWFFWIFPSFAFFFSTYVSRLVYVFYAAIVLYLIHFIPQEMGWMTNDFIKGLTFTLVQVAIFGLSIGIWSLVSNSEFPFFRRKHPLLIGITGDSGAGKNALSTVFLEMFGNQATSIVEGDDYHKWERGNNRWNDYTHLNPRANHLDTLARHTLALASGRPILKSHYDHSTGHFTEERLIASSKNIIVQGLHTFFPKVLRSALDIKVFVDPDSELRRYWKIKRDVYERGHSLEKVEKSMRDRGSDSRAHIEPQKQFADWIIRAIPYQEITMDKTPEFYNSHYLVNDTPLDFLIENLRKVEGLRVLCEAQKEDMNFIQFEVHGEITKEQVAEVAIKSFGSVRQLTRSSCAPIWQANQHGITQLVCLSLLQRTTYLEEMM